MSSPLIGIEEVGIRVLHHTTTAVGAWTTCDVTIFPACPMESIAQCWYSGAVVINYDCVECLLLPGRFRIGNVHGYVR